MPRKSTKTTKSEKKFTTVPPKSTAVATKAVVTAPDVESIKPLLAGLNDLDADIAREAATALGATGNSAAVGPLIDIVSNKNGYFHSVVRSAAAASLGQLKDRKAVDALLSAVNDPVADPSTEAIRALVELADPRTVDALIAVVRNGNNFFANSVRRAAVLGLTKLGGPAAIAELKKVSADFNEDAVIREEATAAIPSK